ncbi:hypothetical protein CYLTODRAFT_344876 [Cylindrobasidium torrendii FP15055 ss-10]|uniref:Rhodopsin domain-containing protein n=1 Tax=Cylindrobasidium torrendii FP15055 ss-10 TaxID=1314674 RepID=A0A0D7BQV9_9AGAR|nr:hypothetical protein CYLTODRAFT_344876 [Cylindrobasidium torrendii FP15055 ss-10]
MVAPWFQSPTSEVCATSFRVFDLLILRLVIATTVHGVAQICTFLRLAYQIRQRRVWLDDGAATFAALASIVWLAGFWVETDVKGPLAHRVNAYWAESLTFLVVVWFTRASVLLSTVRIAPPGLISRKIPFFAVILFVVMWIALMAQRITLCYRDKSWASDETPQCSSAHPRILPWLIVEFFSDIVLLCAPLGALIFGRTTSNQSRLLIVTFITSFALTAVSVGHGVTTIHDFSNHLEYLAAIVQARPLFHAQPS